MYNDFSLVFHSLFFCSFTQQRRCEKWGTPQVHSLWFGFFPFLVSVQSWQWKRSGKWGTPQCIPWRRGPRCVVCWCVAYGCVVCFSLLSLPLSWSVTHFLSHTRELSLSHTQHTQEQKHGSFAEDFRCILSPSIHLSNSLPHTSKCSYSFSAEDNRCMHRHTHTHTQT